jgi:hypothetical protein
MSGIARSLAASLLQGAGRRETTRRHGGPLPQRPSFEAPASAKASGGFLGSDPRTGPQDEAEKTLFPDAEIAENHVQDILDIDPAGEPG